MKCNFGIIGLGGIANKFADTINKLNLNLEGVASRSKDKACSFAQKYHAKFFYDNYEELLKNKDINIIYIATPHGLHYEHLKLCLKYHKNIICEKAFTLNKKQALEIFKIAKENKCLVMEAMWTRFLPAISKIKEIILSKKYGEIKEITASFCFNGNKDDNYRLMNNKLGGGALLDVGIYPINLAYMLLGYPNLIRASGSLSSTNIDLDNNLVFEYNNANALLSSSFVYEGEKRDAIIKLEKAEILISDFVKFESFEIKYFDNIITKYSYPFDINGFEYQILSFIETLKLNKLENDIMPHKITLDILEIMDNTRKQINVVYESE